MAARALVDRLVALAPPGTGEPGAGTREALRATTRALIEALRAEGRLHEDPMALAMQRTVDLHPGAAERVRGRRVLVTGGAGCVGTALRARLAAMAPAQLLCLDRLPHTGPGEAMAVDVRDAQAVDAAFARTRPDVVFHLAAIREPGRAEAIVREAVETNVFGTAHVIEACRRHGVRDAVYASTGKCFAYTTAHTYTATKKLAEMQWVLAGMQPGPTAFATTRFTHVMENGVVMHDIHAGIARGLVGLHGAQRHFNVQNLGQACHLLLNALALAEPGQAAAFWTARDLGWPVNTLELALFQIAQHGCDAGVYFLGVPPGYDECFFRGQFDMEAAHEPHPLINALEGPPRPDAGGSMLGGCVQTCEPAVLQAQLSQLSIRLAELGAAGDAQAGAIKQALLQAVDSVTAGMLARVEGRRLLDVLWWGAAPDWAGPAGAGLAPFERLATLLAEAVLERLPPHAVAADTTARARLGDVARSFAHRPALRAIGQRLRALAHSQAVPGERPLRLSVVLPCYNGAATLATQLEALARQQWADGWEVILVDNGSTDGSVDLALRYQDRLPGLRVLQAHTAGTPRGGVPHAYNTGMAAASGDAFVFCEADDEVADGWLAAMGRALRDHPFVLARLDHRALNPEWLHPIRGDGYQASGLFRQPVPPYYQSGSAAGFGLRRELVDALGPLSADFPIVHDGEYCWRAQLAGYSLHFAADAVVHYREKATLRDRFHQGRRWGWDTTRLHRHYRVPSRPQAALRQAAWLLRCLPTGSAACLAAALGLPRGRMRLLDWVWDFGWSFGRWQALRAEAGAVLPAQPPQRLADAWWVNDELGEAP